MVSADVDGCDLARGDEVRRIHWSAPVADAGGVRRELVRLARAAGVSVEFGGGIRSEDDAAEVLESGVARVVLGTAALEEPALAGRCAQT